MHKYFPRLLFTGNPKQIPLEDIDWTPPKYVLEAQQRHRDKLQTKPATWDQSFRTFRAYADTVLEYLRKKGTVG